MVLADEIVHAALGTKGAAAEQQATEIANKIAAELNAATGSNYDTSRVLYGSGEFFEFFDSSSTFSPIFSITPVGCK
jgi:hypothetical protein